MFFKKKKEKKHDSHGLPHRYYDLDEYRTQLLYFVKQTTETTDKLTVHAAEKAFADTCLEISLLPDVFRKVPKQLEAEGYVIIRGGSMYLTDKSREILKGV